MASEIKLADSTIYMDMYKLLAPFIHAKLKKQPIFTN